MKMFKKNYTILGNVLGAATTEALQVGDRNPKRILTAISAR